MDLVVTFLVVEGIFDLVVIVVGKVVRFVVVRLGVVVRVVLKVVVVLIVVVVVVGRVVRGVVVFVGGFFGGLIGGNFGPFFLPPLLLLPPPLFPPPSQLLVNPCFAQAAAHSAAVSKAFFLPSIIAVITFPALVNPEVKKSERKSQPFLPIRRFANDFPCSTA